MERIITNHHPKVVTMQDIQRIKTKQNRLDRNEIIIKCAIEQMRNSPEGLADTKELSKRLGVSVGVVTQAIKDYNKRLLAIEEDANLKIAEMHNIKRLREELDADTKN